MSDLLSRYYWIHNHNHEQRDDHLILVTNVSEKNDNNRKSNVEVTLRSCDLLHFFSLRTIMRKSFFIYHFYFISEKKEPKNLTY